MDADGAEDVRHRTRTAKSYGPDTSMVGLKLVEQSASDGVNKARSPGRVRSNRKPLRAERRVFWCICGDCYGLAFFLPDQLRVHQAPGVPTPFRGRNDEYQTSREKNHAARSRSCGCFLKIESQVARRRCAFPRSCGGEGSGWGSVGKLAASSAR